MSTQLNGIENKVCTNPNHNPELCVPYGSIKIEFDGFGEMLLESMRRNGDEIAQIDSVSGRVETYTELTSKCVRIAVNMERIGLKQGDIVAFCTMNNLDCYPAVMACIIAGGCFSVVDPVLSLEETPHLLNLLEPKFIFCDESGLKLIEAVLKQTKFNAKIIFFGQSNKYLMFSELLKSVEDEHIYRAKKAKLEDTGAIYFSSGTTGLPKGIALSHFSLINMCLKAKDKNRSYVTTRLCWLSATMTFGVSVHLGSSWVMSVDYNAENILENVVKYKVQCLITPPLFAHHITKCSKISSYDLSSLTVYITMGGLISSDKIFELRKLFPKTVVISLYGITEMCGGFLTFSPKDFTSLIKNPGILGRADKGSCVKIVDVETEEELGPNKPGELRVKCINQMNGYYKNAEATELAFDQDGYFCTGDMLYYDENYLFYFVDRVKDVMKVKTFYVVPIELEEILLSHPDVLEACVISIPHVEDVNLLMGLVKLQKNALSSADDIRKFADEQVSDDYKRLTAGVKILDNIPTTATFKHRRRLVRTMVLNGEI